MDGEIDASLVKRLEKIRDDEEISEKKRGKLASRIDLKFLATLLVNYNATQSDSDVQIFNLLQLIERRLGVSLKVAAPLVFGPKSADYYKGIINYGRNLQRIMNPNDALKFLARDRLINTAYIMCRGPREDLYDPRFILRFLLQMVHRGTELKCKNFMEIGGLQFVLCALSLRDPELRAIAYVILQRFLSLTNELTVEDFPQIHIVKYFLRMLKHSIDQPNRKIPSPVTRFLAHTAVVILYPTYLVYKPLMASLSQRPDFNLLQLPEFRKFFFSSSSQTFDIERKWITNICAMSVHEPGDYQLLNDSKVIGSCLAAFTSNVCHDQVRKKILSMLHSSLRHPSCAKDLFFTHNLSAWLASVAYHSSVTEEELKRIQRLHEMLHEHATLWLQKRPDPLVAIQIERDAVRVRKARAKNMGPSGDSLKQPQIVVHFDW